MADTDEASAAAADEARRARQVVERDVQATSGRLSSHCATEKTCAISMASTRGSPNTDVWTMRVLPLAVENTNVKAQRLSFGPAREAVDAFRGARSTRQSEPTRRRTRAVRKPSRHARTWTCSRFRSLHAPHIAEAEDAGRMTRMEEQMAASGRRCSQGAPTSCRQRRRRESAPAALDAAAAALDRFNVRSTRRSSRCHGATATCGRSRCPSAESGR